MFDIIAATSPSAINQLKSEYARYWSNQYVMSEVYNIWYYTSSVNDPIVMCRVYYQYSNTKYYCNYMKYDTNTGKYIYHYAINGVNSTSTNSNLSVSELSLLTLIYPIPISNTCFPAKTSIITDQGIINIEQIDNNLHTIQNKKIIEIVKTINCDKHLICFEKNSLYTNYPNVNTIMSKEHKILYKGQMIKAYKFLNNFERVKLIKYNGEILYNILMENHCTINVHNLICETLHPKNIIARLYTSLSDEECRNKKIIIMNNYITHKKNTCKKICNILQT